MPRRSEGLQLRGKIYWLRVRVPDQLRPILGKLEVRRSLGTSDASEAKRRVRIERLKVEAEFDNARLKLAALQTTHGQSFSQTFDLTEAQVWTLATQWFVLREKQSAERNLDEWDEDDLEIRYDRLAYVEKWDEVSANVHDEVQKILVEAGLPAASEADPTQPWRSKLSRAIQAAMVESERRLINRMTGRNILSLNPSFQGVSAATDLKPVSISAVTLAELIKRYESDPARAKPSPKTKLKQDAQHRLFKEVIGAKTLVTAIDREMARKLLDTVKALPSNATKRFPGRKIEEVLQLSEERGLKPMSATTANSYMSAFVALMNFALKEHLIDKNPATGLRLPNDGVRRQDKRLSLTVADLSRIFAAPLYTGCLNDEWGYARPGSNRPRRGRFWIPIIALFLVCG